jgi:hypothetical protein
MSNAKTDVVDVIIADWRRERPELDPSGLEVAARIAVMAREMQRRVDRLLKKYDLAQWSFDVLAALRRTGEPYRLSPTVLSDHLGIAPEAGASETDTIVEAAL